MKARAPGKLVLSGAYAVLHGAPALVAAVDRYVIADTTRAPTFVTPETRAALPHGPYPYFDASALRAPDRKLGLGSSAAIVVACVGAARAVDPCDAPQLEALFRDCLAAHRAAQGGGSGIDVAAACFGGTLCYRLTDSGPELAPVALPPGVVLEVWSCREAADTRHFLQRVAALGSSDAATHRQLMSELDQAARFALDACQRGEASDYVTALRRQAAALMQLGEAAAIPIFTSQLQRAAQVAALTGAVVLPAGAGGGDIALFVGSEPPSPALREAQTAAGLELLAVQIGAPGLHLI